MFRISGAYPGMRGLLPRGLSGRFARSSLFRAVWSLGLRPGIKVASLTVSCLGLLGVVARVVRGRGR